MGKRKLLIILAALVIVLGGAYILYSKLSKDYAPEQIDGGNTVPSESGSSEGEAQGYSAAPDFTVYDAAGKAVRLSDLKGKPVIFNFWASWCGPCKSEMPEFEAAFKQYGDQIQFMMINLTYGSETRSAADSFISSSGYTFPVYYDTDGGASGTYGVSAIPTTYFVNAKGELIARGVGALDGASLKQGIEMIIP